ncbi:MAG: hypothetical protein EP329_27650 [Deltaproteobacteria bacterium]|nr:MAG: hypothetical protein EP329_27650 [Deltaproteobacteria bacterium]
MSRTLPALAVCLASLGALLPLSGPAAAAAPEWRDRVGAALVDVETAWQVSGGVLIGDGRTALVTDLIDTGRALEVHRVADPEVTVDADARVAGEDWTALWILTPKRPLAERGLTVATDPPSVGDAVWLVSKATRKDGALATSLGETRVTAVAAEQFAIDAKNLGWRSGSPVLNAAGELLGLLAFDGRVVRVDPAADRPEPEERGASVLPLVGFRLGGEAGGLLDGAFIYDVDAGVTLWDRLSIVSRFGFGLGEPAGGLQALPATDELGPGVAQSAGSLSLRLGLEARYRLYLGGGETPFYIDLAGGFQYAFAPDLSSGPTFRSGDLGCDPLAQACPLQIGAPSELGSRDAFDASFGVDLRFTGMTLGYRFLPGLGGAPAAHQITFGATFF